ncbi:hypothetical protein KY289_026572 [Solanum tuberosum]|nr:hypothetical protein KY289_026572 [Solanum tuberosum]
MEKARQKTAQLHIPPSASSEPSSSSEAPCSMGVRVDTTIEQYSPRVTRSWTARAVEQYDTTLSLSKEVGDGFESEKGFDDQPGIQQMTDLLLRLRKKKGIAKRTATPVIVMVLLRSLFERGNLT